MNRGMKKWAPYKSLNEQADFIAKMRYEKNKIDRPIISSDAAEEINNILVNYHNQILHIKYYEDGYLYEVEAPIFRIDADYKRLYFDRYSYLDFINIIEVRSVE